ncbi:MAG TPA: glycosyltransferase family 4 protein [Chloroflexia bacterium]|nr:glycosyltransferase family 4 protein [Chloroflexia bacterium]
MLHVALFIDGTFIPSYEGATRRFVGLARYLAGRGVAVTVFHGFRGWSDIGRIASEPFQTYFLSPDDYYRRPDLLSRLFEREQVDAVVMKNFGTIITVGRALKGRLPDLRLYFEVHDVCADYSLLLKEPEEDLRKIALAESYAFSVADLCVCFSEEDRAGILSMLRKNAALTPPELEDVSRRVVRMPFGCDPQEIRYGGSNVSAQTVLFLGNLFHPPNARAVEFLRESVYPRVVAERPNVRFLLVGPAPESIISGYGTPSFRFMEAVPDLNTIFGQTTLAIAPMFEGTGIKVKVLDYCMAGLPTLCTTLAVRGIAHSAEHARAFVLEDDADRYAEHVLTLLAQPARLAELSAAAYDLSRTQSWPLIVEDTIELYSSFHNQPRRPHDVPLPAPLREADEVFVPFFLKDTFRQQRFEGTPPPPPGNIMRGGKGHLEIVEL